jgi:Cof subfamily protein (haloacid dehalogenase superfamily)
VQEKWLIAVDLDGTLFGADHQVSPRTADALHAVAKRGHSIVVVTGRSAHSAIWRLNSIPPKVRVICSNGAYEYDRIRKVKSWSQALSTTLVLQLRERILEHLPSASFGWESANGLGFDDQFITEAGGADTLEQGGMSEAFGQSEVLKLYVRTPQFVRGDLQRQLTPILDGQAEVSTSGAPFVELTAPGVDKASGLARVAADLGFTASRTIAFGDNLNDLPMLRWAFEAVAMGNALEEVKAIASTHTLNNFDDGVATLLENRLKSGELA